MKRLIMLVVVLVLVFTPLGLEAGSVRASTPVLLAEFEAGVSNIYFCCEPTTQEVNAVVFALGYGFDSTLIGDLWRWVLSADAVIGEDVVHYPGQSGVFDFNAFNSPDFNELTARMTNGIDEDLWGAEMFVNDANPQVALAGPSSIGTGPESAHFDTSPNYVGPDLVGAQIDFIRLVVKSLSITFTVFSPDAIQINTSGEAVWQIYGTPPPLIPLIEIMLGPDSSCLNHNGHGVIPVVIFSSQTFDATQVDPTTVSLDGQGVRLVGNGKLQVHTDEDVNSDGLNDLVMQIEEVAGTYLPGDTTATLTGETFDGIPIQATDSICILP